MRVPQNNNHVSEALGRVVQQYSNATNLQNLISAFVEQIQLLEDAAQSMYTRLDIDASEGVQLDKIGDIVGIARQGYSDTTYRILIKGKIAQNTSKGTPEDIIQIYNILTSGANAFLMEVFPAQIAISNDGTIAAGLETLVKTMVEGATAAGVGLDYIGYHNGANAFGFAGSTDGAGFGNLRSQGTNTSTGTNKLIDSAASFLVDGVTPNDRVYNDTDNFFANVITVDSATTLTLSSNIFTATGKSYHIVDDIIGGIFAYIH
jgi:hypothetical protein